MLEVTLPKWATDLLAIPVFWNVDYAAVRTYVVVLGRNSRWLLIEMSAPSEAHIYVFRNSVAIHFPVARYDDWLPVGVVKVNLVEIGRALVGILLPS